MADVKWIKITTDIFDDEKILLIESLPEADSIIVIWFKLLCLAGKMNNSGVFTMNNRIAYTDKMLATIFRRKESTVQLALKTFESYGMIEVVDDIITIPNWGKHQNVDKIEAKNNYMKEYMREYREKQKNLTCKTNCKTNSKSNVSLIEEDKEREEEKEVDKEKEKGKEKSNTDYQQIIDLFNDTCVSFPKVRSLSDARKKAIKARLKTYSADDLKRAFEMAEASDFLKGKNNRDWQATYDWIMCDRNMAKILDGNYNNRPEKIPPNKSGWKNDSDILDGIL